MAAECQPLLPLAHDRNIASSDEPPREKANMFLPPSASTSQSSIALRGLFYMVLCALCQSTAALLAQQAERRYGFAVSSVMLMRGLGSLTCSFFHLSFAGFSNLKQPPAVLGQLALRGLCGSFTALAIFHAVTLIPAGIALTLLYISPTLTSIASALLFSEPFTLIHAANLMSNFLGIALVTGVISNGLQVPQSPLGVLYSLIGACSSSGAALLLRRLGVQGKPPVTLTFAFGVSETFVALMILSMNDIKTIMVSSWFGLLLVGLGAVVAFLEQHLLAMALRKIPTGTGLIVRSLSVPMTFLLGWAVLGETVDVPEMLGVLLVVGSVVVIGVVQSFKP